MENKLMIGIVLTIRHWTYATHNRSYTIFTVEFVKLLFVSWKCVGQSPVRFLACNRPSFAHSRFHALRSPDSGVWRVSAGMGGVE